jgi:threonine dehydrogenase-like Zn-dependent dehydrogenase
MATSLGVAATANPREQNAALILRQHGPFDIVIEAAGNQSALDLCTPLVKEHGRIVLIGYHQSNGGMRSVNMEQWNLKAIDVVNGHVRRQDEKLVAMRQGIDLLAAGHLVTKPMLTTYPLGEINTAFKDLITGKAGLVKAVLVTNP